MGLHAGDRPLPEGSTFCSLLGVLLQRRAGSRPNTHSRENLEEGLFLTDGSDPGLPRSAELPKNSSNQRLLGHLERSLDHWITCETQIGS